MMINFNANHRLEPENMKLLETNHDNETRANKKSIKDLKRENVIKRRSENTVIYIRRMSSIAIIKI